jgi:hypothetical protein
MNLWLALFVIIAQQSPTQHPPGDTQVVKPAWTTMALGQAGEPFVATDDQGHVYVTGHIYNGSSSQAIFYASSDHGATFPTSHVFNGTCCDFQVHAGPAGIVYVSYLPSGDGVNLAVSSDFGASFSQDKTVLAGPLDREWIDTRNGNLDAVYSDGYIGGPVSKGVFFSTSANFGDTFTMKTRMDNEPSGTEAIDPMISCKANVILGGWLTSTDRNSIDAFRVSRSTDGGQTFQGHTTIFNVSKAIGDTQERWISGVLVSCPGQTYYTVFQNYALINVDGTDRKALLLYYRRSTDGGATWSAAKTVTPLSEIKDAIRHYQATKWTDDAAIWPYYIQHEPWVCIDPYGTLHVVWFDNRDGQNPNVMNSKWRVYHGQGRYDTDVWEKTDAISESFLCVQPNLDYISCAADSKYVYCAWIRRISQTSTGWSFSGDLFFSRRPVNAFKPIR